MEFFAGVWAGIRRKFASIFLGINKQAVGMMLSYLCHYWVNKSHASFNYHSPWSMAMLTSKIPTTDNLQPGRDAWGAKMSLPATWNIRFSIQMLNLRNNSADSVLFRLVFFSISNCACLPFGRVKKKGSGRLSCRLLGWMNSDFDGRLKDVGLNRNRNGIELDMRGWHNGCWLL